MRIATAVAALVSFSLTPGILAAQGSQQVALSVKVPATLRNVHPDIKSVFVDCRVLIWGSTTPNPQLGEVKSQETPLTSLSRAADGSYSGEFNVSLTVDAPADAGGRTGSVACEMNGCLSSGVLVGWAQRCFKFHSFPQTYDPRLAERQPSQVQVNFVW